ncbi:MAG: class I SAM-dependent methyltransferase, partial [Acidobacteria bacterium]|nr:class I SAM-dependent methyltransferase [Acidobacteriota bacterium]
LKKKFPGLELIESTFENMPAEAHAARYDVVLMSESLQFMDLERVFPVVQKILRPGGRWLVVDFFRKDELGDKSGQPWSNFVTGLKEEGWHITEQWDHTENVLPLLRYVHMLGNDVFRPLLDYAFDKLKEKQPGVHYLLEEAIDRLNSKGEKMLDVINPASFAARKKYVLMAIERS